MNFNLKKILLSSVILISLFCSYSSAMNEFQDDSFIIFNDVSIKVSEDIGELFNLRGANSSYDEVFYDGCHNYFSEHPRSLANIHNGRNSDHIASGIYDYSDFGDDSNKNIVIKKISEILFSFKDRGLRESICSFIYKSGNISSITVFGIAGLFLLWGILAKIIDGDNIGIKVAICSGLVLFITLKIRNIAFN